MPPERSELDALKAKLVIVASTGKIAQTIYTYLAQKSSIIFRFYFRTLVSPEQMRKRPLVKPEAVVVVETVGLKADF